MNNLRNVMRTFLAVALVAFALPAIAQDKIFSLTMSPPSSAGSPATLTATFKNLNPTGNSSFNSLVLTAPPGLTITAMAAPPPSGTATITNGGQVVQVANMSPVRPGMTFALQLTVSAAGATSCTSSTGDWSAVPWTGSSFSGSKIGRAHV